MIAGCFALSSTVEGLFWTLIRAGGISHKRRCLQPPTPPSLLPFTASTSFFSATTKGGGQPVLNLTDSAMQRNDTHARTIHSFFLSTDGSLQLVAFFHLSAGPGQVSTGYGVISSIVSLIHTDSIKSKIHWHGGPYFLLE